jgi:chromosome segregation ATPase
MAVEKLQFQVDELKNVCQTKDEDLQKCRQQLHQLREDHFSVCQSQSPAVAAYERTQFDILEQENSELTRENDELKARFLRLLAKKSRYKSRYRQLKSTSILPSPTSLPSLQVQIAQLSTALELATQERDFARGEMEAYKSKLDQRNEEMRTMRAEAKDAFATLRSKLDEERSQHHGSDFTEQINDLQARLGAMTNRLTQSESTVKSLEFENSSLHGQIDRLDGAKVGQKAFPALAEKGERDRLSDSEAYTEIVDALKQILEYLSPNALNLPTNSELRQLFAALCNMLNAAIDPLAGQSVLVPHIKSLAYQARVFAPKPGHAV